MKTKLYLLNTNLKDGPFTYYLYSTFSCLCLTIATMEKRSRDSVVDIATRYGLDGPGIESLWEKVFPHPSRPALGPTPYNRYRVFPGGKAAGGWC